MRNGSVEGARRSSRESKQLNGSLGGVESLVNEEHDKPLPNLKGDRLNMALLMFLYILQGVPLGLANAIPLILQNRKVTYNDQAMYSLVSWPFSLKLLWAPIVDAVFWDRFGRRKSWLVPTQYMIGIFMLVLAGQVDNFLSYDRPPNVAALTAIFFTMKILAATQDVAVDGWCLTMLRRENVGYASMCSSVGMRLGYSITYILFLALESPDFCNEYLRTVPQPTGIVDLAAYLWFWGIIFVTTTTLVAVFKREKRFYSTPTAAPAIPLEPLKPLSYSEKTVAGTYGEVNIEDRLGIKATYMVLLEILRLPAVRLMVLLLFTYSIGVAANNVRSLKLVENGLPRERLALLSIPLLPIQILAPLIFGRYAAGPKPLSLFRRIYPCWVLTAIPLALSVYVTSIARHSDGSFPSWYYVMLFCFTAMQDIAIISGHMALTAFYNRVSDPLVGGTYITMLHTVSNIGNAFPNSMALLFVDVLTWKRCTDVVTGMVVQCPSKEMVKAIELAAMAVTSVSTTTNVVANVTEVASVVDIPSLPNLSIETLVDGFYVETGACILIGLIWLWLATSTTRRLQSRPTQDWEVKQFRKNSLKM